MTAFIAMGAHAGQFENGGLPSDSADPDCVSEGRLRGMKTSSRPAG